MTNDTIFGIMDVDYPELSGDDRRAVQLGEMTDLPDGKSVAEYIAEVEAMKAENLRAEDEARNAFLAQTAEPIQENKEEETDMIVEEDEITDSDLSFEPEISDPNYDE